MKNYKKWIIGILVLAALLLGCMGISGYLQQKNPKKWSLIYIPKVVDGTNDFWTSLIAGARTAADEYNASLEVTAPDQEMDVQRQNELLEEAIAKRPDAILISPSSFTESEEYLKRAKKKGIRIVYIDSYTEEPLQDLTVATDNLEAGRILGEYAAELIGEKEGKIAIVAHVQGVSTALEREKGFREGLGDLRQNVAEVVYCDSQYEKAYELTKQLMEKYPDLVMIAGMNEYSFVGAARAVRDEKAQDRIALVGIDSSQEAVELMEEGIIKGVVVQKAFKMGYLGVSESIRMLSGQEVETNIDSGCELVTPENMYDSEIEKLIFPFNSSRKETEMS